jgi:hypothetical protein
VILDLRYSWGCSTESRVNGPDSNPRGLTFFHRSQPLCIRAILWVMDPLAVRSFMGRAYDVVAESKQGYWARRFRKEGAEATWRAGQALREHAHQVRPDWPSEEDRAEDLEHHIRLTRLLDSAAHAFPRR